ncbi:MAG: phage terminase small subunit [Deltaproteobacteria bacterium]|nr:phage terminase small subunit [Deltaproteobacteria bacterium]
MSKIREVQQRIEEQFAASRALEDKKRHGRTSPATVPVSKLQQVRLRNEAREEASRAPTEPPPPVLGKIGAIKAAAESGGYFEAERLALKGLTLEAKREGKLKLLVKYRPHVESFFASANRTVADPIVPWYVIWLWDAGDIEAFISLSRQAEALGQHSPIATPINEFRWRKISEWAWEEIKNKRSPMPYLEDVFSEADDMPESLSGFFHKLMGEHAVNLADAAGERGDEEQRQDCLSTAESFFESAQEIRGEKSGVKTILAKVKKWITGGTEKTGENASPTVAGSQADSGESATMDNTQEAAPGSPGGSNDEESVGKNIDSEVVPI